MYDAISCELGWRVPQHVLPYKVRISNAILPDGREHMHVHYSRFRRAYRMACRKLVNITVNDTVNECIIDRGAHESSLGAHESSLKTSGAHESSLKTSNTGAQESCLLCKECTEDPDDSPREAIQLAKERTTIKDQVQLHLQKKLVGYILQRIHLVQDFIKTYCYEDHRGFLTEKRKHMVQKLNQALEPWVRILGKITTHTRLNQLSEWSYKQNSQDEFTVYARVNLLSPSDLYIGETQNPKTPKPQNPKDMQR